MCVAAGQKSIKSVTTRFYELRRGCRWGTWRQHVSRFQLSSRMKPPGRSQHAPAAEWGGGGVSVDKSEHINKIRPLISVSIHADPAPTWQGGYFRISPVSRSIQLQQQQQSPLWRDTTPVGRGTAHVRGLIEQVSGLKVATTGTAGWFECDFWKRLTKALPPVGGVASSSTPQTVQ